MSTFYTLGVVVARGTAAEDKQVALQPSSEAQGPYPGGRQQ